MKRQINLYHVAGESKFSFSSLDMLKKVHDIEEPSLEDIESDYIKVASFELEKRPSLDAFGSIEDDYAVCEMVFVLTNSPAEHQWVSNNIDQEQLREHMSHTSTSVGDIVEIEGNYYYCDSVGFVKINPEA